MGDTIGPQQIYRPWWVSEAFIPLPGLQFTRPLETHADPELPPSSQATQMQEAASFPDKENDNPSKERLTLFPKYKIETPGAIGNAEDAPLPRATALPTRLRTSHANSLEDPSELRGTSSHHEYATAPWVEPASDTRTQQANAKASLLNRQGCVHFPNESMNPVSQKERPPCIRCLRQKISEAEKKAKALETKSQAQQLQIAILKEQTAQRYNDLQVVRLELENRTQQLRSTSVNSMDMDLGVDLDQDEVEKQIAKHQHLHAHYLLKLRERKGEACEWPRYGKEARALQREAQRIRKDLGEDFFTKDINNTSSTSSSSDVIHHNTDVSKLDPEMWTRVHEWMRAKIKLNARIVEALDADLTTSHKALAREQLGHKVAQASEERCISEMARLQDVVRNHGADLVKHKNNSIDMFHELAALQITIRLNLGVDALRKIRKYTAEELTAMRELRGWQIDNLYQAHLRAQNGEEEEDTAVDSETRLREFMKKLQFPSSDRGRRVAVKKSESEYGDGDDSGDDDCCSSTTTESSSGNSNNNNNSSSSSNDADSEYSKSSSRFTHVKLDDCDTESEGYSEIGLSSDDVLSVSSGM